MQPSQPSIQSALRQVPHIRKAKSAVRGPRPDAFQLITGGRLADDRTVGHMKDVPVEQRLGETATVVCGPHLVAELVEAFAMHRRDLDID